MLVFSDEKIFEHIYQFTCHCGTVKVSAIYPSIVADFYPCSPGEDSTVGEERARRQEARTKNQESRSKSQEARVRKQESGTRNYESPNPGSTRKSMFIACAKIFWVNLCTKVY